MSHLTSLTGTATTARCGRARNAAVVLCRRGRIGPNGQIGPKGWRERVFSGSTELVPLMHSSSQCQCLQLTH